MSWALKVKATKDYYRISGDRLHFGNIVDGVHVPCLHALIKEGRKFGKRQYSKTVVFVFDSLLHEVVDISPVRLLEIEKRRGLEFLTCGQHHPEKCVEPPYKREVVHCPTKEPGYVDKKLDEVLVAMAEYLDYPGKFDSTRLGVLKLELRHMLDFRRKGRNAEGGSQIQKAV